MAFAIHLNTSLANLRHHTLRKNDSSSLDNVMRALFVQCLLQQKGSSHDCTLFVQSFTEREGKKEMQSNLQAARRASHVPGVKKFQHFAS